MRWLLIIFTFYNAGAQPIRFKGTYGSSSVEYGYSAIPTFDNGYAAVGSTSGYSSSMDVYFFKTDSVGKMKWFKNIGTSDIEVGRSLIQTKDTCFVIAGYSNNVTTGYDVYIIKTNRNGDTLWTKRYGGTGWDFAYSIYETYDSGFVVAGGTYSFGAGDEDFYLLRLNRNGDTLWTKTYGGVGEDEAACVIESSNDSGFVMVGKTNSFADITGSAYVIKTDKNGILIASEEYGGSDNDYLTCVVEAPFINSYIAVGGTSSFGTDEDVYLMRMDYSCDTLWTRSEKTTSLPSDRDVANSVAVSWNDSCFAFAGLTASGTSGYEDVFFFKFDSNGVYKAATGYGTTGHDIAYSIVATSDKGFIICGQTDTTMSGVNQANVLLVKTDSVGFTAGPFLSSVHRYYNGDFNISVYPNPVVENAVVYISSGSSNPIDINNIRIRLYDLIGKETEGSEYMNEVTQHSPHSANIALTLSNISRGIYILELTHNSNIVGRLRILKD